MRRLLGPRRWPNGSVNCSVSRARAIDDAAAMMRRLERDLHDGAQIRLATLAMNLGMAHEKLGDRRRRRPTSTQARELVALAHRGAKDALADLRDLVRGIHPPVLDNGLGDALATLATSSAIPVAVTGSNCPTVRRRRSRRSPTSAPPNCSPTRPNTAGPRIGLDVGPVRRAPAR